MQKGSQDPMAAGDGGAVGWPCPSRLTSSSIANLLPVTPWLSNDSVDVTDNGVGAVATQPPAVKRLMPRQQAVLFLEVECLAHPKLCAESGHPKACWTALRGPLHPPTRGRSKLSEHLL